MTMVMSPAGRAFLTREEGERLVAYRDSVGVLTIGVGHTSAAGPPTVTPGMKITRAQSQAILTTDLSKFERYVNDVVKVPVSQNEFDALVSFTYNVGPSALKRSSVVKLLNADKRQEAADAFLSWSRAGNNKTLLLNRRKRERDLFLKGGYRKPSTTKKVAVEAKNASKQSPIATGAIVTGATASAGPLLSYIGSWEAVAALGIILVAAGVGYIIWRRYIRTDQ